MQVIDQKLKGMKKIDEMGEFRVVRVLRFGGFEKLKKWRKERVKMRMEVEKIS